MTRSAERRVDPPLGQRRAIAALVGVGLLALALLSTPPADRAAAADCAWQRHSKRVVKHVRRHGKPRRVVRVRHWWNCEPLVGAPAPQPPPAPAPVLPPPEPEPSNRLGVKSAEYYFLLSRPQVSAGEVTVELNNRGEDAHDLHLQLEGGAGPVLKLPETASLQQSSAHFELPAGTYKLWCGLPTHEEQGMRTTLIVGSG